MDSINEAIAMMEQFDKRNTEMADQLAQQIAQLVAQIEAISDILKIRDIIDNVTPDAG